jgi:hypothetical protein
MYGKKCPENLGYAVRTVKFMRDVRLNGIVEKRAKGMPVVSYVILTMIV